jgi:hypothetical protein
MMHRAYDKRSDGLLVVDTLGVPSGDMITVSQAALMHQERAAILPTHGLARFSLTRIGSRWLLLMVNVMPISIQIRSTSARRATSSARLGR